MNFEPSFLIKINKLLPSRYNITSLSKNHSKLRDATYTVRDASKKSRKKYKTRQKEKICVKHGSE